MHIFTLHLSWQIYCCHSVVYLKIKKKRVGNWISSASPCVQIQMIEKFKTLKCGNLIFSISTWYIIITDTLTFTSPCSPHNYLIPINYFITLVWSPSREQTVLQFFHFVIQFPSKPKVTLAMATMKTILRENGCLQGKSSPLDSNVP